MARQGTVMTTERPEMINVLIGVHPLQYFDFCKQYTEQTGKAANPKERPLIRDLIAHGLVSKLLDKAKMADLTAGEMEAVVAKAQEIQAGLKDMDKHHCHECSGCDTDD